MICTGVQAGVFQVFAHGTGQHAAVGIQPGHKPLRRLDQLDQVVAQGRLAACKGQLRNSHAAALFNDGQPLVGIQFGRGPQGLVGSVAVQAFLVAVPGTVLLHGTDHQVHAMGGVHPAAYSFKERGCTCSGGVLPRATAHRQSSSSCKSDSICSGGVRRYTLRVADTVWAVTADQSARGQFLAAVRLHGLDEVGQHNGPADMQGQNVLPVEDGHKGGVAVRFIAGNQVDAYHTGTVGVQGDVPHTGKMPVQKGMFRIGSDISSGKVPPVSYRMVKMYRNYTINPPQIQL